MRLTPHAGIGRKKLRAALRRAAILALAYLFAVNMSVGQLVHAATPDDKWQPHLDLEARPGTDRIIGEGNLFVPLYQNPDAMLFTNLRGLGDSGPAYEGSFILGYRNIQRGDNWGLGSFAWGIYGAFDSRFSENDALFLQGGGGFEILSEDNWDLRGNFYIPEGGSNEFFRSSSTTTTPAGAVVEGTAILAVDRLTTTTITADEYALPGFDVEAGYGVALDEKTEVWAYPGYFYFDRGDTPSIDGPRLRLELRMDDVLGLDGTRLTVGGLVQHDDVRGVEGSGLVRLRIPLGSLLGMEAPKPRLTGIDARMTERIQRDVDHDRR